MFGKSATDGWRGFTMLHLGELAEAEQLLDRRLRGAARPTATPSPSTTTSSRSTRGRSCSRATSSGRGGRSSACRDTGEHADGPRYWLRAHIELLLAEGKPEEALEATFELERRFAAAHRSTRRRGPTGRCGRGRSRGWTGATRPSRWSRRSSSWRASFGAPGIVGRTLRDAGPGQGRRGRDRRPGRGRRAAGALARAGWSARGRWRPTAARCGAPATRPTRASRCAARWSWPRRCGAAALAEQTRSELYATGARPRTDARLRRRGAHRQRAARGRDLAADGSSNRDIAQALFVTPKTVEVHLSNAYRKLGIRSRRGPAGRAGRVLAVAAARTSSSRCAPARRAAGRRCARTRRATTRTGARPRRCRPRAAASRPRQ